MNQNNLLTDQDLIALERTAQVDPRVMQLIAGMTPEQCQQVAQESLKRRISFVFDLLANDTLKAIACGGVNMAQTCRTMLAPRP